MKHAHVSKTEFETSFFDVSLFDFDLYILNKYIFIPLLVLCIPILWGPAMQCVAFASFSAWFCVCRSQEAKYVPATSNIFLMRVQCNLASPLLLKVTFDIDES